MGNIAVDLKAKKVLIACLGNIFYGDDGFGAAVAGKLSVTSLPANVSIRDFGIRGVDLAFELANDYALVILVDILETGAAAGEIFAIEVKTSSAIKEPIAHDLTPDKALAIAQRLNAKTKKVWLVGCQPENLGFNDEMSEAVKSAVPRAVGKILEIVKNGTA